MPVIRLYTILLVSFFFLAKASGQVFDAGPSDSSLFTNVINVPEDAAPADRVGGVGGEIIQLNLTTGGTIGTFFDALEDSEVNVSGGTLGTFFLANEGSEVNISGGTVGPSFGVTGGRVTISGGIVNDSFFAGEGSDVTISGGTVQDSFDAGVDSVVNIIGGSVGNFFDADDGSVVNIIGGSVGELFFALAGSEINISGGSVGDGFDAFNGSVINISGGSVGAEFLSEAGSTVNLFGSDFVLDGVPLADLIAGEAFTIAPRDVTLSGLLADGSAFSFDLNSELQISQDHFAPGSTLTVTLSTEVLLGDTNQDGVVDFSDISSFIMRLTTGEFLAEADADGDGNIDFDDIGPFILLLSS